MPFSRSTQVKNSSQQWLRFDLSEEFTALIEIERVVEVVDIPRDRVVPIPDLPPAVLGVYNWRGEILWIVDLSMLLGIGSLVKLGDRVRLLPTTIVSHPSQGVRHVLGLVVDRIADLESGEIQPIDLATSTNSQGQLSQFISNYGRTANAEILAVLDAQSIFERAELHSQI
jgi:positive phototaxis protein PixI